MGLGVWYNMVTINENGSFITELKKNLNFLKNTKTPLTNASFCGIILLKNQWFSYDENKNRLKSANRSTGKVL